MGFPFRIPLTGPLPRCPACLPASEHRSLGVRLCHGASLPPDPERHSASFCGPILGHRTVFPYDTQTFLMAMKLGEVYLESVSTGIITQEEIDWITTHQAVFSREEEAMALKIGRQLDEGTLQIGCRLLAQRTTVPPDSHMEDMSTQG